MPLLVVPSSRFFVTFFRWSQLNTKQICSTGKECSRYHLDLKTPRHIRHYNATRILCDSSQPSEHLSGEGSRLEQHPSPERDLKQRDIISDTKEYAEKRNVRAFLRKVPNAVVIITAPSVNSETGLHVPMGVAISSCTSVTLDPPIMSFNLKQPSQTLDAIRAAAGQLCIHFPKASKAGAQMVELFCQGNHEKAYKLRTDNLDIEMAPGKPPQINALSVQARMHCTVTHQFDVGDHVIITAAVNKIWERGLALPTLVYAVQRYMSTGYTYGFHAGLSGHEVKSMPNDRNPSVWDFPLFPQEQERRTYLDYIEALYKANATYLLDSPAHVFREFEQSLPCPPVMFGINMGLAIAQWKQDIKLSPEERIDSKKLPILADFYGRLTAAAKLDLIQRLKTLVQNDPDYLLMRYDKLLVRLGVSTSCKDVLPSGLLDSLRAEGLAGEYDPMVAKSKEAEGINQDIVYLEMVEQKLRKHLRTLPFNKAVGTPIFSLMESIGEDAGLAIFFRKNRMRILADTHTTEFNHSLFNIRGELDEIEIRVVLNRVVQYLRFNRWKKLTTRLTEPPDWILMAINVHPSISNFNIEYLMARIRHLHELNPSYDHFGSALDEMTEPFFGQESIQWSELEERIKGFVEKYPLRAISWTSGDLLAAMGLSGKASVTVTTHDNETTEKSLIQSAILPTLIAKELSHSHGKGSEAENEAIAKFLREQYGFDVVTKTDVAANSSAKFEKTVDRKEKARSISEGKKVWPSRADQKARRLRIRSQT